MGKATGGLVQLGDVPIFKGTVDNVYIRDVATVKDGADIQAMPLLTENVPYISILQKQVMPLH